MDLDDLITQLEALREQHGGECEIYYIGLKSPVGDADAWTNSYTNTTVILLTT